MDMDGEGKPVFWKPFHVCPRELKGILGRRDGVKVMCFAYTAFLSGL